ncbi:MAG: extracellular solute-binding protein [Roseiflexaceae bacterium]|nr:extracellular solute-binding protein [Roseiflexaceae bacterium]
MVSRTPHLSAFMWLSLVACVVAACGATPAAPAASDTTSAAADTTNEPRTLTVWGEGSTAASMESDPTGAGKYGIYLKETFEKEHPGVTLNIEDHGWDEQLRQNLTSALLAGNPPDVVVGEGFFLTYAQLDALLPLDDVIADVKDNVVPGTIKGATYQDKVYGLPAFTGVFAFERNCAVVKEAGLDCSKAPATWEELTAQATEIT